MTLFLTVLEVTAPVFLIAAIGFGWVKAGYEYPVEFVTRLGVLLATPCLVFTALVQTEIDPGALADLSLATLAVYAAITLACWGFVASLGLDRRTFLAPIIFGNTGNLGLPLVLFALAAAFSESLIAIAGVAAIAGGVMWKFPVITRACHQQGFSMPKMPQRGSGERAAPARLGGL